LLSSPHLTIQGYNVNPNFLTYLVSGDQHCFTPMSLYFTAGLSPQSTHTISSHCSVDAVSNKDNGANTNQPMMYEVRLFLSFPLSRLTNPTSGQTLSPCLNLSPNPLSVSRLVVVTTTPPPIALLNYSPNLSLNITATKHREASSWLTADFDVELKLTGSL
jgi:hypothetical protein